MDERRKHVRLKHEQPCTLILAGQRNLAELIDVSLKGALVAAPLKFSAAVGAEIALEIPLGEPGTDAITMSGSVAALHDGQLSLSCTEIDLDSITHLRRLLELNLGDPDLIERELSDLSA
jgi:hypothetical protein